MLLLSGTAIAQNYSVPEPRMRVNKSSSLQLTTSWQTLIFNGTSTNNFNTYGTDPVTSNKMVWHDSANTPYLFKFYGEYDKNYSVQLFIKATTTIITTPASLQYRFVIPNGVSPGVDYYFPFPDDGGYGELFGLTLLTTGTSMSIEPLNVFVDSRIRTNGFYIQVKLSNSLFTLGTSTINSATAVISSKN